MDSKSTGDINNFSFLRFSAKIRDAETFDPKSFPIASFAVIPPFVYTFAAIIQALATMLFKLFLYLKLKMLYV